MDERSDIPEYRARLYSNYGEAFQGASQSFDAGKAARWGRAYDYYLRHWLPESKTAAIVDLGCGYGRFLYFLRERGYENLVGVDISPGQVAIARQVVANVHLDDALSFLESHPDQFDFIISQDLIEHLTKTEILRLLDGCCTALRPGGRLVLMTPNPDSPFGAGSRYHDFTHEIAISAYPLSRLLAHAGFRDVAAREVGPVPLGYSLASSLRWLVWQLIRGALLVWNVAETGSGGSRVLTRHYTVSAIRADR